jgi:hypothetical protein
MKEGGELKVQPRNNRHRASAHHMRRLMSPRPRSKLSLLFHGHHPVTFCGKPMSDVFGPSFTADKLAYRSVVIQLL